jgi:hypothetical protein
MNAVALLVCDKLVDETSGRDVADMAWSVALLLMKVTRLAVE